MTVAVPVARPEPQRRTDGDVVDDELGRDHRRERRERERELFQPVDHPLVGQLRRDARRGRGRGLAPQLLRVHRRSRSPARSGRRPRSKNSSGDPRSAFSVARDEYTERHAVADERVAAITARAARPTSDLDRRALGNRHGRARRRARDTSARPRRSRAAGSVAGSTRVVSIFASSSRHAASSSSTSSARSVPDSCSRSQAARLDRVEPGEGLVARESLTVDPEEVGDPLELVVDFARRPRRSRRAADRSRASSRSMSGVAG